VDALVAQASEGAAQKKNTALLVRGGAFVLERIVDAVG